MPKDVYSEILALKLKHRKAKVKKHRPSFPDLTTSNKESDLSHNIAVKGGFKRNMRDEHKWRRGSEENAATVAAIEEKAKRIRPHFNKGGYQFSTDGDNSGEIRIYRK